MLELKCNECSTDVTSLFQFSYEKDKDGLPAKRIARCPECNTQLRVMDFSRKNGGWRLEPVIEKAKRTFRHPDFMKIKVIEVIGQATEEEIASVHRSKCYECGKLVHLFMSYLINLRGNYFPQVVTTEILHKDGKDIPIDKVSFRPPMLSKIRVCKGCFDKYAPEAFLKDSHGVADVEQLPDPINKMRDGLKFVAISQSMKASKYEVDINENLTYQHKGEIFEEQVIAFGCSWDDYVSSLVFRPSHNHLIPGEVYKVAIPPIPSRPYKPKQQLIRVKPTKTVRWNKDIFPWIGFAPNKERRRAFLKGVVSK